jgi:hypothetical protein
VALVEAQELCGPMPCGLSNDGRVGQADPELLVAPDDLCGPATSEKERGGGAGAGRPGRGQRSFKYGGPGPG